MTDKRPLVDLSNVGCGAVLVVLIGGFWAAWAIVGVAEAIASCFGGHPTP